MKVRSAPFAPSTLPVAAGEVAALGDPFRARLSLPRSCLLADSESQQPQALPLPALPSPFSTVPVVCQALPHPATPALPSPTFIALNHQEQPVLPCR